MKNVAYNMDCMEAMREMSDNFFDIDREYFEKQEERFAAYTAQLSMFRTEVMP